MNFLEITSDLSSAQYKKNEYIFRQNEEVTGIYYVADGILNINQYNDSNVLTFQRFVYKGDTVGHRSLFIHKTYSGSAMVLSDTCTVYFMPLNWIIEKLTSNIEFSRFLISKISSELQRAEEDRINFKKKMAVEQLAIVLLDLANNYSTKQENGTYLINCEITKRCLAQSLLMAEETVIRLMSEFKNEKIIDYIDRRINILKLSKLKEIAQTN